MRSSLAESTASATTVVRTIGNRRSGLLLVVAFLGGCGVFNPYDHAVIARPVEDRAASRLELAGDAEAGLQYAEAMRSAYYDKLATSAYTRSAAAVGAVGLTGWALYNALKPTGSDVATTGDTRRSVRLGAGLGALYGLRQFFLNPEHEKIYAQAYEELTCLMYQTSPLLMTQLALGGGSTVPGNPGWQSALVPSAMDEQRSWGDVERLEHDMQALRHQILLVWTLVDLYDARVDAIGGRSKEIQSANRYFTDRSRKTKEALRYANNALYDAGTLLDTGKGIGGRIRSHVGLVVASANERVQANQNNLADASALLKSSQGVASGIKSIGVQTQADQVDVEASASASNVSAASISDLPRMRPVQWVASESAARAVMVAAAPGDAATVAISARKTTPGETTPAQTAVAAPKAPAKARKAAPPKPAPALASADGLKKIRKEVDAAIDVLEKAEADRKKQAELDALKRARLDLRDDYYSKAANVLKCDRPVGGEEPCLQNLLVQTERLYALRRPLVQALSNLQARIRRVADAPECADLTTLRVTPTDPTRVAAGSTVEYLITQKNDGENPTAVLQGPAEEKTGASLKLEAIGGTKLTKVVVKLGEQMTTQRIRIVVSDSRQLATQILIVNVVGVCKTPAAGDESPETDCKSLPAAAPSTPKTTPS